MGNFLRSLCITISAALFSSIPSLYSIFYDLSAQPTLFLPETIQQLSKNLYVLISVVMLFAFASKAIASIINPDLLFDSKKGFTSIIKRSVIALILVIAIPYGFEYFYKVQNQIMNNSLIEKLTIGLAINDDSKGEESIGNKAGQILAATAFSSVVYPNSEDGTCDPGNGLGIIGDIGSVISSFNSLSLTESFLSVAGTDSICTVYAGAINYDIKYAKYLVPIINAEKGSLEGVLFHDYVLTLDWYGILSVLVAVIIVYFLIIFCMDTALRLIKMGFLELTAPISVIAYIFGGNDILKKWWKEVTSTSLSVFGRIAALAFMVLVLARVPVFLGENFSEEHAKWATLFMIIASLIFVKKVPEMIERIFGLKIGAQGGISGRLGQMAVVGKLAQNAWKTIGNAGKLAAGTVAGGIGYGASKALGSAGRSIWNKIPEGQLKNNLSTFGNGAKAAGKYVSAGTSAGGGIKGAKAGAKAWNESAFAISRRQAKNQTMRDNINDSVGVDRNGRVTDAIKSAREYGEAVKNSQYVPSAAHKALEDRNNANLAKSRVEQIKKKSDHISEMISEAIANNHDDKIKQKLSNLDYDRKKGNKTTEQFLSEIQALEGEGKITSGAAAEIRKDLTNMTGLAKDARLDSVIFAEGKLNMPELNAVIENRTDIANTAQANLDGIKATLTDESQKLAVSTFESASDKIVTQYVKDVGKKGTNYDSYAYVEPTPSPNGESTSGENNSTQTIVTPTGDGNYRTSSGIILPGSTVNSNPSSYNIQSPEQNTSSSSPINNGGDNSSSGNNSSRSDSSNQDLSGFFDGLSQDIKNANNATNSILNDQLKAQQSTLEESRKQTSSLNNISSGVDNINTKVNEMNNNIKTFSTTTDKNLKDISRKLDNNESDNDNE